jgi:hypothetical protein
MNDRDLMAIRADTDFTYDARGRMLQSNEPHERHRSPAPRLFLGRTPSGHVIRFGATVPDRLKRRLRAMIDRQSPPLDLRDPPSALTALREAVAEHAPIASEGGGPTYRFPASIPVPNGVVEITAANVELARDTFPWLLDEYAHWWRCFAAVRDGAAVSVCFSSRVGARAHEAGVETAAAFRGHGYATAATAVWAAAVRAAGRIPVYSTSWENLASQGVARRLGLIMFGSDVTLM